MMDRDTSSFSERLRRERKRLGLTQSRLADLTGTSRRAQNNYETSKNSPAVDYLIKLHALGFDAAFLVTGVVSASPTRDEALLL